MSYPVWHVRPTQPALTPSTPPPPGADDEKYRRLFEGMREAYVQVDMAGRIVDFNEAFLELAGHADDELRALTYQQLTPARWHAEEARIVAEQILPRGWSDPYEKEYQRKDGRLVPVELRTVLVRDAGGRPAAMWAFVRDITDRKRAEAALRESEARARRQVAEIQSIYDSAHVGLCVFDRDLRFLRINRRLAELNGQPATAHLGRTVDEIVPALAPLAHQVAEQVFRTGEGVIDVEFTGTTAAQPGVQRTWVEQWLPLLDEAGQVMAVNVVVEEVTERRRAEEALREADRRKTEFLAVLSHELRNPLGPIRNSIVLLESAPPDGPVARRAREVLRRQTDHLVRLVDDLLDLSRITHGKMAVHLEPVDVRELVRRSYLDAKAQFDARGVELTLSDTPEPLWIAADPARFAQMVGNLLNNALKFTAPRGLVQLKAARRGDACEVSVKDDGEGLDPADLERIFDPFEQGGHVPEGAGGLGLGLALVKRLAAKHGGAAHARSDGPGRGAEFLIELPLLPMPDAVQDLARAGGRRRIAPLSIVVIEDNEDAAASLSDLLGLGGHAVATANSGRAGLEAVAAHRPDVIVCDIGLPDMSGHDVIRAVREAGLPPRPFAVALTGYAQPRDRNEALSAGFDAHLPKPPPLDELEALLGEAAHRRDTTAQPAPSLSAGPSRSPP